MPTKYFSLRYLSIVIVQTDNHLTSTVLLPVTFLCAGQDGLITIVCDCSVMICKQLLLQLYICVRL